MKKLLAGLMICLMGGTVMAAPPAGFDIVGTELEVTPGQTYEIPISVTGPGNIQGMSLYVESTGAPFPITDLLIDNAGTVWSTTGTATSTGATVFTYAKTQATNDGQITHPYFAAAYVTAVSNIAAGPGSIIGKIVMAIPADAVVGTTGSVGTVSPTWGDIPSDFVDAATQDTLRLKVVPEPVSALLLLAGIPLLRRRHA